MRARKRKTKKRYVIAFEEQLEQNLLQLQREIILQTYKPKPLQTFILRDPKTRKISKSDFRDRVVHHAICNIIEPLFDKTFISDSYANRKGKGAFSAINRFEKFKNKVSNNNSRVAFVFKADIKHYFGAVDHTTLLDILKKKINDEKVLSLVKTILKNYCNKLKGKGMPLGNLTSQFFANIYLNELDQFIKHNLQIKYYIRYVDDFVILHHSKKKLKEHYYNINMFLNEKLHLELHPDKSKIIPLRKGVGFLGFRIFHYHKLVRKKNQYKFERKFNELQKLYQEGKISREKVIEKFEGWLAYIHHANTYKYRNNLIKTFNQRFPPQNNIEILNAKKHDNFIKKVEQTKIQFSVQKTLYLYKKGLDIHAIAKKRNIKEQTVWNHFAKLIELNQLSVWNLLSKNRIYAILSKISTPNDTLKNIKERLNNPIISFDEIQCVLANIKAKNKKRLLSDHMRWYQSSHCYRKCYFNLLQRKICKTKFNVILSLHSQLKIKRNEFLELFNNHINICILSEKEKIHHITRNEFINWRKKLLLKNGGVGKQQ